MNTVTAKEAKTKFGQLLDKAQREPVTITKNGRPVALVMALEDEALLADIQRVIDDRYWGERANRAEAEGFLSSEESEAFLAQCANA